ncbi:MAG TPA: YgiQ family radical SAM protein, partial [Candidatus Limnocylindrales bacterium]|nr:YgiQ family radical SAM protein [Candidatus Limnocylindrales bacterium]
RGWDRLDFIIISGDAYVDHPSFGVAIISRQLEANGFKVGIIAQPDWKNINEFKKLGKPALGFLVTGGNIDSMVNHYTVAQKKRRVDAYSPGGKTGLRPDRAAIVYSQKAREAYRDVPIILGGIEASLRRLAHYDCWDDTVRRSILLDAKADLLLYGMSEKQIIEVAEALQSGISIADITYIRGTVYKTYAITDLKEGIRLPSYDEICTLKELYAKSFMTQSGNTDSISAKLLIEPYANVYVIQNPPAEPLSTAELDMVYRLPFRRTYHPVYEKSGGVPAITEVKFSLVSSRGCFGGCSFCSLHFHQGRTVQSRSIEAILAEAKAIIADSDFKGYIHDVGGPTANFRNKACKKQDKHGMCTDKFCLYPAPCTNLIADHTDYLELLRALRNLEGVKKVFIRSGIRYDYLLCDQDQIFFEELCRYHISGQLKVAPEHVSPAVLEKMGKPGVEIYKQFKSKYKDLNKKLGMEQHLVPYFMSSHPGSDLKAAIEMAVFIKNHEHMPEQVQDFYPTPGTLSTCMYYTGIDPRTMEAVYVPKTPHDKAMQRALLQFKKPQNYQLVHEALKEAGRKDLIGFDRKCLIKPRGKKKSAEKR